MELINYSLGLYSLSAITGGFTFVSGALTARTSEGIAKIIRDYLYDHIQRLTFSYHNQTQTGELIQRATSDIDAIRRFFSDQAIGVGRIFFMFIVNFIAIGTINWGLAWISIIIVPFSITLSIFFFRKVTKAYEAYQEQDAVLSNRLQENLTGVRVVKAFARQAYEVEKFEVENWEKFMRGRRLLLMHSLFWPISDIMTGAQMLTGFFYGASPGNQRHYIGWILPRLCWTCYLDCLANSEYGTFDCSNVNWISFLQPCQANHNRTT